ncbi:methionine-synthesizing 5- methyltetrahydropteroyltriglutamate--homocysteine methyltransferase [Coemansia sp. RSA 2611]|uniref:5-methyltetrahydropteroyltriglutamate--homocysteine S-methyltransferase n=2 Tax=Coemansia TaxID=4863 RepID=A0A9W8GJG8_9FUNG|nr:methionine-synthesizing 5- methyltetrahydropteroyltriglutamate--homocysteine methyltransferase [Coemansia sp. RSA 2611]KAJ2413935.1 methionine-synthesizing 5- methyltetrahydropteroyltriglutamate--homocysteine methyltransferase [Coemansia sp. RSA 2530]KAJ2687048.1 methionine-synthesizing 5- methyltetrahydropteroyltriglutamate--homocysteine methyltransferase [Coemansia spiralis]
MSIKSTILGFPRMGSDRQLKKLVEGFWSGKVTEQELADGSKQLRADHWALQASYGLTELPVGDFSYYDHVLDAAFAAGIIPERYQQVDNSGTQAYFAMGRGLQNKAIGIDVPSLEMKKWFDTNYHYMVPEVADDQTFSLHSTKVVDEFKEAQALGYTARPVVLGPVSLLALSKTAKGSSTKPLEHLAKLLPVYVELFGLLAAAGAEWVQVDEPVLSLDLDAAVYQPAFAQAYTELAQVAGLKYLLTSYFGRLGDNLSWAAALPVHGIHLDLVRGSADLDDALELIPTDKVISAGLINGRNIWKANLDKQLATLVKIIGARQSAAPVWVNSSCSLLHSPHSLKPEAGHLDQETLGWLSFAEEKVEEVAILAAAITDRDSVAEQLQRNAANVLSRQQSERITRPAVQQRLAALDESSYTRQAAFNVRQAVQRETLKLPLFPTTTIGSFPQTAEVRKARAQFRKGALSQEEYLQFLDAETRKCIEWQDEAGLDVLVHGEFERTDMVEFFGEHLEGFVFTKRGWVQSYGSRCVKPPVIFGDVSRPNAMTVDVAKFAQSCSPNKPVKGMLTGPVTILQWSFVRDDQPRSQTAGQIALAIRDEVVDLEAAGIRVIQVDEPAIREGLPLRKADYEAYLKWSVDVFRLATTGVRNETQIHTHFCYSDFNEIFTAIKSLDADVITIENSKSDLKLLGALEVHGYAAEIGPGLYDIHSPRVPSVEEMAARFAALQKYIPAENLWANPDCGLKTRGWPEVKESLTNLVAVAVAARKAHAA